MLKIKNTLTLTSEEIYIFHNILMNMDIHTQMWVISIYLYFKVITNIDNIDNI